MIPTNVALRTIADLLWRLADQQDVRASGRGGRPASAERTDARREAVQRLRAAARRLDEEAATATGASDPAVLGYLCAWVRGHSDALDALLDYLHRRQDPRWQRLRAASHADKAGTVLAALGL